MLACLLVGSDQRPGAFNCQLINLYGAQVRLYKVLSLANVFVHVGACAKKTKALVTRALPIRAGGIASIKCSGDALLVLAQVQVHVQVLAAFNRVAG